MLLKLQESHNLLAERKISKSWPDLSFDWPRDQNKWDALRGTAADLTPLCKVVAKVQSGIKIWFSVHLPISCENWQGTTKIKIVHTYWQSNLQGVLPINGGKDLHSLGKAAECGEAVQPATLEDDDQEGAGQLGGHNWLTQEGSSADPPAFEGGLHLLGSQGQKMEGSDAAHPGGGELAGHGLGSHHGQLAWWACSSTCNVQPIDQEVVVCHLLEGF